MKDPKRINDFISTAFAIEAQEAKEAGALGYMARSLVQATLPHKQAKGNEFSRTNGAFTLSLMAPSRIGLPYGSIPRILISWIATEAVRTQSRELVLGNNLSEFLRQLDYEPRGGVRGDITRIRNQMRRLFASFISCSYTDARLDEVSNLLIADRAALWWDPKDPDQTGLFESTVTLSERFYTELIRNPVPVDLRALKALKRSPMALDIYCWLTHRMSYLRRPTVVPWEALQLQFGADYRLTRQFKAAFLEQLRKVTTIYGAADVDDQEKGLLLRPSPTHIKSLS